MAKENVSRGEIGAVRGAKKTLARRTLVWLAGAAIMALLISGCAVFGFLFMPEAAEADIRAGFAALAKTHAWAQEGKTIIDTVPSITEYTSADGTVTLTVELKAGDYIYPIETNSYTISAFKDPDSEIVVEQAQITVTNTQDNWGDTAKSEQGFADFSSASTLERLDFALYGKQVAWGETVDYEFFSGGVLNANYKDVGYLRVPMIY